MNDKPKFLLWRIRKELPDGMFTSCEYTAPFPVDEDHVRTSPAVIEWLGEDRLDEIYHPEAVRVPTVPAKRCTTCHRYFDKPSCPYCEAMKRRSS